MTTINYSTLFSIKLNSNYLQSLIPFCQRYLWLHFTNSNWRDSWHVSFQW